MEANPPPLPDLLAVVREFLERDILPGLEGETWFNLKVALNLLAAAEREARLDPEAAAAERTRLARLIDAPGATAVEMNRRLALAIRDGRLALDDPALREHLRRSLADTLRINNPRWLER